jgi:hypothetical protein
MLTCCMVWAWKEVQAWVDVVSQLVLWGLSLTELGGLASEGCFLIFIYCFEMGVLLCCQGCFLNPCTLRFFLPQPQPTSQSFCFCWMLWLPPCLCGSEMCVGVVCRRAPTLEKMRQHQCIGLCLAGSRTSAFHLQGRGRLRPGLMSV